VKTLFGKFISLMLLCVVYLALAAYTKVRAAHYAYVQPVLSWVLRAVLLPVYMYCMDPRNGMVKYDGPADLKELEATVLKKFGEVKALVAQSQDAMNEALEKEVKKYGNTIEAKTADLLKELGEKSKTAQDAFAAEVKKLTDRILEVEQKGADASKLREQHQQATKSAGQLFAESESYKTMMKTQGKNPRMCDPVEVPSGSVVKTAILNATLNNDQPLVQADRQAGIIAPPERRLLVRNLLPQIPTDSNVIEFVRELVFTSNAGPQGSGSSPAETEGQVKPESGITFELANAVVITLAHWIPASRQVLADAKQLAGYIDSRLFYGLNLEEEDELLNSTGTAGELNGIRNQATAFAYGSTNLTALDALLKAFLQVSLVNYEATGVVLNPIDWVGIQLLKDTTGRYLFTDPQNVTTPRVWGKDVIPTATMTAGRFLTGAFNLGAAIYDREGTTIRVSDQHSDFFTRNMVAILCEKRVAFAMYRPTAFVEGPISHAG
jgi:HK97 family phage major capsid protein